MSPLTWVRVADVLRDAGLPVNRDAVQEAALLLRSRQVPVTRNGGNWKVQADHPETKALRASLEEQAWLAAKQAQATADPALTAKIAEAFRHGY